MDNALDLLVTDAEAGVRLDRFLVQRAQRGGLTQVKAWLEAGAVTVDGRRLKKGDRLRAGQRVRVLPAENQGSDHEARESSTDLQAPIVFEDAHLIVVNKPAGLPTHGLRKHETATLTAQLLQRFPELQGVGYRDSEPGVLHRLDNDTSGLLIVARTAESFALLRAMLMSGAIEKRYVALCSGRLTAPQAFTGFLVSARRARVRVSPVEVPRSRAARTDVIEAKPNGAFTLVTVGADHAGRHQIRAHLAHAGHPLAGDLLYDGPSIAGLNRHFLHASELRFQHPVTGAVLHLRAPLPPALTACLHDLEPTPSNV